MVSPRKRVNAGGLLAKIKKMVAGDKKSDGKNHKKIIATFIVIAALIYYFASK